MEKDVRTMRSIEVPFQQWIHIVRNEYDYEGKDIEYENDGFAHIIGNTFQYAVECRYDFIPFVKQFISSDVFRYFGRNFSMYSQSPYHILASFDSEMIGQKIRPIHLELEQSEYMEVAYWLGYFLMKWSLTEGISGEELAQKYDIGWLIEQYQKGDFRKYSIHKSIQATRAKFDFKVL